MTDQDCLCGHAESEHNYTPSGTGSTACHHSESLDEHGWPIGNCGCSEYFPQDDAEPCANCGAEPLEKCRPSCTALAAHQNELQDRGV